MSKNPWLLPEGMDELVGEQALCLEALRRQVLDHFESWGYDLVIPPLVEYTDALLTGIGQDLDLQTFKLTDQLSGRAIGLRADMSPQAARIDAHTMKAHAINRLCYAGTVLRANADVTGNRAPVQAGAELFGLSSMEADLEICSLMLACLRSLTDRPITLALSNQLVRKWLDDIIQAHGLDAELVYSLLEGKRLPEWELCVSEFSLPADLTEQLLCLPRLSGDRGCLARARELFSSEQVVCDAIDQMEWLADGLVAQHEELDLFFDVGGICSSDYHSGILFSAYTEISGVATRLANGGRYDEVGAAFGRARPATGFSVDLKVLAQLSPQLRAPKKNVYASVPSDADQMASFWREISRLRAEGYRVTLGYSDDATASERQFDLRLVRGSDHWALV